MTGYVMTNNPRPVTGPGAFDGLKRMSLAEAREVVPMRGRIFHVETLTDVTDEKENWPRVPSDSFPEELTRACPRCGSRHVILEWVPRRATVPGYSLVSCGACGLIEVR